MDSPTFGPRRSPILLPARASPVKVYQAFPDTRMDALAWRDYQKHPMRDRPPMPSDAFLLRALRDPRLAVHATAARGAWLWSLDGSRLLWVNATAAMLFDAAGAQALTTRTFETGGAMAQQIAELAARLPHSGTPRLERLYGFGAALGQRTTCSCARLTFPGGTTGILVVAATAPARPLTKARRLASLIDAIADPVAIFDADGRLAAATDAARPAVAPGDSLASLGLESARDALEEDNRAEATTDRARFTLYRLGHGADLAYAAILSPFARPVAGAQIVEPANSPIDAGPALSEAHGEATSRIRESVDNDTTSPGHGAGHEHVRPLRFVWRTDAEGRFTIEDGAFAARMDAPTVAAFGRPWRDIAASFGIDPGNRVADALASRATWNAIPTDWPLDRSRRVGVELSGAAIFDGERQFAGYRGFGLCRDPDAVTHVTPSEAAQPVAEEAKPTRDTAAAGSNVSHNVVRFPAPAEAKAELRAPALSPVENRAFDEIARQLSARLQDTPPAPATPTQDAPGDVAAAAPPPAREHGEHDNERPLLERLPLGVLVYRLDRLLYANRVFLDHVGHSDLGALTEAGGLDALFIEPGSPVAGSHSEAGTPLTLASSRGGQPPVQARLIAVSWDGDGALALVFAPQRAPAAAAAAPIADPAAVRERDDLRAILDATSDGIAMLDADARILAGNRSAERLTGLNDQGLRGRAFADLFDADSRPAVLEALQGARSGAASPPQGREVLARHPDGKAVPLSLSLARLPSGGFFARLTDLSQTKAAATELAAARRRVDNAAGAKSDAIGRISQDIRTPLSAIIGFADVMIGERFGPVGNPRYIDYLKDIRASGERVVGLIDDMGNLSRAETGKIDLAFTAVALNEVIEQCVATLQPQANRERIIIRTSLAQGLPLVTADARTLRQVALNLIATSIRLNQAGGQVIVSTALTDNGDVALRVRDTGAGLSAQDLNSALEPHRMSAAPDQGGGASGAGISLALTRALVEANRARFDIRSAPQSGTLIEVIFTIQRQAMAR